MTPARRVTLPGCAAAGRRANCQFALQIGPTRLAPDDALDPLRAEAGRFRLLHDVAHLVAQAAGQLALLVGGAAGRVARAVVAVAVAVAVLAARLILLFRAAGMAGAERPLAVFVAVAAARAVVAVAVAVFAAPLCLLLRAAVMAAATLAFAVFVAVAAARAVVVVAVLAARLNRIFRAAVPATHAAGRPSAAAPLMNDNRYVRQSISPIYWPVLRPAQRRGLTFAFAVTLHRPPIWL